MQIDSLNIHHLREDTPGVRNVIHFNNAGAALQPLPVFDAVEEYLQSELQYGGYETASKYTGELENFYHNMAAFLNCKPSEIAFAESATAAWDILFYSLPFKKGDKIITVPTEYASNYIAYLQMQRRTGLNISVVPVDENGDIDLHYLEKEAQDSRTKLITVTHIPTGSGIVNSAETIGEIASKYGIPYLLDACQSVGQLPIDVQNIKCDYLTATGRKYLRGPRGTGFLYIKESQMEKIEPFTLDLHSAEWTGENDFAIRTDAKKFEKWECYFAGKVGLAAAVAYAQEIGINAIWERVQELAEILRKRLQKIPQVEIIDQGRVKSGIVSFALKEMDAELLKTKLGEKGINVSLAIESGTYLDMHPRGIQQAIRSSVHYYNTEEEIERFIAELQSLLGSQ